LLASERSGGSGRSGRSGRIAEEQAALRRVATLVARAALPEEVFAAVTAEVGRVLSADFTVMGRHDPDGGFTVVGAWSETGAAMRIPVGIRLERGGRNLHTLVFRSGGPARIDDYADASGPPAELARELGFHSAVGAPISVEGQLWGFMSAVSTSERLLPADTEARLAGFIELVATAIGNAQARVELRGFAEEQAALRRVATLVARAASPEEVFAAVTAEVGRVLCADITILSRYDPDGAETAVGVWSRTGALPVRVGHRTSLGGRNVTSLVFRTGRPARIDDYADTTGSIADVAREVGIQTSVGVPVSVEGRLWGVMISASGREASLPADTEARLAGFTELVATAVANAQARTELRGFADEQAALRQVATLVARAAPPEDVFAAVAAEMGRLLEGEFTVLSRYDPDGAVTVVGGWARTDPGRPLAVGIRLEPGGRNMHTLVFRTRRPARIDDYVVASGQAADVARDWGFRSAVGAPISVEGRLWGVISVASNRDEPLPADTEARLAGFTELVATAIADAEAQDALTASRARIVATADATRRRIERDLHDGAQQRLVSLALHLNSTVRAAVPPEADQLNAQLDWVAAEIGGVLDELREIARGLHPVALAEGGLRPALRMLARRSAVPVGLDLQADARFPEPIELAAYYVVAEALTNTAKHASASVIDVLVETGEGVLHVRVRDDGRGGADLTGGSGLLGLTDRVEALGGRFALHSPSGAGTTVDIELPIAASLRPDVAVAFTGRRDDIASGHAAESEQPGPARGN
jgi:GAF domain-containing protein